MKTRRQVGKGFNAWFGKLRKSTKMCYKRDFNKEVVDYLSKSFSADQASRLTKMFLNNNDYEIKQQMNFLNLKVSQTRRFRSFFNKCFFEKSMDGKEFFVTIEMVKTALIKMKERQIKQHTSTIKEYSRYDNGTWH